MAREMKPSGIEWIGEIPREWETDRLQWHLNEINVQNSPVQTEQVLSLTIDAGVILYEDKGNQGNKAKENYDEYKLAYPDTLVVNSMNIIIGAVGISKYFGCVSPVYYVFKAAENTDLRYIYYLFTNVGFQKEMRKYAKGILEIRLRISASDMLRLQIPKPTYVEQHRIADFLDRKCAEIDAVIEKTKSAVEEYKKLKQSVITEAVTKGIRGPRPMKPSGVEWIGDVPEEWTVARIKDICHLKTGSTPSTANPEWFDGELVWFTPSDFSDCYRLKTSSRTLSYKAKDDDVATMIPPNSVLIIGIGGTAGKVGYAEEECSCNQQITALYDAKIKPLFLMYWMIANSDILKDTALYTTLPILNNQTIGAYPILAPFDEAEESEIVSYLDRKCAGIDNILAQKQQFIKELESYKKSLIYEYVTGKKEVK